MALTTNKIGEHEFIALKGEPQPPAQTLVLDDRLGIDGTEAQLTGLKGKPFSLVSQVDQTTYANAKAQFEQYKELIGGDPVALVHAGQDSEGLGYRVLVLGIEVLRCLPITGASGNLLNPPSAAWLECRWDLLSVPYTA